jgi:hypothetical protein
MPSSCAGRIRPELRSAGEAESTGRRDAIGHVLSTFAGYAVEEVAKAAETLAPALSGRRTGVAEASTGLRPVPRAGGDDRHGCAGISRARIRNGSAQLIGGTLRDKLPRGEYPAASMVVRRLSSDRKDVMFYPNVVVPGAA